MKILIVSPVFWPESFRVNDMAEVLVQEGHDVEVLAGHPNYPEGTFFKGYHWFGPWKETRQGVRVLRFPQIPRGRGTAIRLILQYLSYVLAGMLRLILRLRWDWDAILVFQVTPVTAAWPALLAGKLSRAGTVIWVQDLWPEVVEDTGMVRNAELISLLRKLSDRTYKAFDRVLTQSLSFKNALQARGIPAERLECVYNWAEPDYLTITPEPQGASPWAPGFTVLFAGNLGRAQGLPTIIQAAEKLKNIDGLQWVFLGDGAMRPWLEKEILRLELGSKVFLLGRHPIESMPRFYSHSDVLLLSLGKGSAFERTLPGKLQGYLAAGRPVLAIADGEVMEVLESAQAGRSVPAESPDLLAEAVMGMMALSREERLQMGASGRAFYQTHCARQVGIGKIEAALRSVARGSHPR